MLDFIANFSLIGSFFVNLIYAALVAAAVALGGVGLVYFKSSKKSQGKFFAFLISAASVFFLVMIFWTFIIMLTLREVPK
ncbi:MAG: hypothetical protein UT66_C0027G0042 [candidate division CPR2 bacterium GW2011_GWC1_39_9]|uniref:Uncharacterized protein n=1 Tax=candidate division CPR2 bacterium GW2011_GWC2_39_10 TaxID=1618345 RepID=A0A0G0LPL0_UNCC2|nr:MAG: hypothetical protein UT18_C0030G0017 [candidate division CPR2 bacterium GW2011_GWC2_39_10]KKR34211.1 MAG: hypothetical protein UT66_C0027G0042 [candidate division CPR2 bacterium GW2011_GWC1_39_9]